MTCASCGVVLPEGAKFCFECGAPQVLSCAQCGHPLIPAARFCLACGAPAGRGVSSSTTPQARSERRVTSVLFGDLVEFTALSEGRDPEEVRELLGGYFERCRMIVSRYGGTIEKFVGDAVMAVWGVPTAHEDDAERAVRAGMELVDSIGGFGELTDMPGLSMRVGVVTGEVAVTVGATQQAMVAGDAVNTASRLQAEAAPGAVWVDEQTRALTAAAVDFAVVGERMLRGKTEPLQLYRAVAVMASVGGARRTDRVEAPLIGRRRELAQIKECFHGAAEDGRARLLLVCGDPGIGKTRLGWELEKYTDGLSQTVRWHWGRCLAYGDAIAFSALSAAVRGRIGVTESDDEAATLAKLDESLVRFVADPLQRDWLRPRLALLLRDAGDCFEREDLLAAWRAWFEALGGAGETPDPVVWVIDDAHHADDGLLDFVEHLITAAAVPFLIVLLARPELLEQRPRLATMRRTALIRLEILPHVAMAGLLDSLVRDLPSDARDDLIARAEGVPLYAIETVRALADRELAVAHPDGTRTLARGVGSRELADLGAPASLQVLVSSRLDTLDRFERSLLATAAVLGSTFTADALGALTRRTAGDLEPVLERLVRRDLLRVITDRLSPEYGQYAFVQSVVRQVAYRTLARRDRLHWHLAAATHLQTLPEAGGALAGIITRHLLDAHDLLAPGDRRHDEITAQVVTWLEHTGDRARALGSPVDALRSYGQALQRCAAGSAQAARIRLAAAEVASAAGRYGSAIRYAEPLPASVPAAQRARVDEVRAWALRANGDVPAALLALQPWLAGLDRIPAETGADVCRTAASCHLEQGDHRESRELAERGLLLAEDTGDARAIARSLNMVALSTQAAGQTRMALALYKGLAEFARGHGLTSMVCLAEVNIGACMLNVDPEQCVQHSRDGIELGTQTGELARVLVAACNVAMACRVLGRWDEVGALADLPSIADSIADDLVEARWIVIERAIIGLARGEQHFELPEPKPDEGGILAIWNPLPAGILAFAARDFLGALAAARAALAACMEQMGLVDDFCHHWTLAVDWAMTAHEYHVARELLDLVEDAPPGQIEPLVAAQLPRLRGSVEAEDPGSTADPAAVEADLRAGIQALDRFGAAPDRARAQATLGLWLLQQGRTAEATPLLHAARATFGELRAAAWLHELDASLSRAA